MAVYPLIVNLEEQFLTIVDTNNKIETSIPPNNVFKVIKGFIYGIPVDTTLAPTTVSGDLRLLPGVAEKIFPIAYKDGKLWCEGRLSGAWISQGEHLGNIVEGAGVSGLEVRDEGIPINSSTAILNFVGTEVLARTDYTEPTQVNVFIPPPEYASHFNTTDGLTNALVNNISTTNRHIANPTSEGNPYKIGDWTPGSIHPAFTSGTVVFQTPETFSCTNNSTTLKVTVFDADETTILAENQVTIDNNKTETVQNITIEITDFQTDADKYQAKMRATIDLTQIIPHGGRISIKLEHDDQTEGVFVKEQNNIFYDTNENTASIQTIAFSETPSQIQTTQISGVYFYTTGSQFTIDLSGIDYLNDRSYPDIQVQIDGSQYGLPQLNLLGPDLTDWDYQFDDTGDSYHKEDWAISAVDMCKVGESFVQARTVDWTYGSWLTTPANKVCINTLTENATRIFEDFRTESQRLTRSLAQWDSTQSLLTYDDGTGLQQLCSRLVYPQINFQEYAPNSSSQPDYSSASGDRLYIRRMWHDNVSHSNGRFQLSDYNITEDDLTNHNIEIWVSLNGIDWFCCNDDYNGGELSNGDGCRVNKDEYSLSLNNQIAFTFGLDKNTDETSGGGWGMYIKIIFKDTPENRSKYIGSIAEVTWV